MIAASWAWTAFHVAPSINGGWPRQLSAHAMEAAERRSLRDRARSLVDSDKPSDRARQAASGEHDVARDSPSAALTGKMALRQPPAKIANVGMRKLSESALVKQALEALKRPTHLQPVPAASNRDWSPVMHQTSVGLAGYRQ
jgi:hypothetical protein